MEVNFVFQVRTFHRFKREVKLSANAQALWLELFGLFNESRFPETMPISTTHLSAMLDISKDGVIRARKELIENGLLAIVGERRGRQHTTYQIKYFTITPVQPVEKPVDNLLKNEGEAGAGEDYDAGDDATCDAKNDGSFAAQETTQLATQKDSYNANIDANCDTNSGCDANCVDICGTYINYKRVFKLKRRSNGKPKRSLSLGYIKKSSPYGDATQRAGVAREGELCYNEAWRTDARARARTAQNVIDALGGRQTEYDLNETICRYFKLGMTPDQALAALRDAGDTSADMALNEAAFRLGVYHAAKEAGMIDVFPETLHACYGNLERARRREQRQEIGRRTDIILMCMPGYRKYLSEGRLEERRIVLEKIEKRILLGWSNEEIIAAIRDTEEYKAYAHEQELAE